MFLADRPMDTSDVMGLTDSGLAIFGVSVGLRPELMLAGLWGAFWALSYANPTPWYRRVTLALIASIIAAYSTPAIMLILELSIMRDSPPTLIHRCQFPTAVTVGFLTHRIIGPFLLRFAQKKADEVTR